MIETFVNVPPQNIVVDNPNISQIRDAAKKVCVPVGETFLGSAHKAICDWPEGLLKSGRLSISWIWMPKLDGEFSVPRVTISRI